jgi:heme exporter protein B
MSAALALFRRDLLLSLRQGSDAATALAFFVLATAMFPLGVGPEPAMLARIAAGLLWALALLASLIALERLFLEDYQDGSLDLLLLAPGSLPIFVLAKLAAHWLVTGLPIILAAPVLALLLQLPPAGIGALALALLLGTPTLGLVGAVAAALTLGARRSGLLMPLLVLPLYVPVLVFGAASVDAAVLGTDPLPHLSLLGALLLAALAVCPWLAGTALRQAAR